MMPVLVKGINFLNVPLSVRIFGDNKTYRGFFFGILGAIFIAWVQFEFDFANVYLGESFVSYGLLMGAGALVGDSLKSMLKRRLGRGPGTSWFPFDQLDFVVVGLLFVSFVVPVHVEYAVVLIIITPLLHRLVNWLAYSFGLKEVPY